MSGVVGSRRGRGICASCGKKGMGAPRTEIPPFAEAYQSASCQYCGHRSVSGAGPSSEPAIAEGEREAIARIVCGIVVQITCAENATDASIQAEVDQSWHHWTDTADRILAQSSTPPASKVTYQSAADCPLGTMHGSASTHGDASGFDCCDFCGFPADDDPAPPASKGVEVPAGWKLVPVEPTAAMIKTGQIAYWQAPNERGEHGISIAWTAMLAAAPTPSNDTLQGRGEGADARDTALQAIIDRITPGCSSSALAALGALSDIEVIARAALQKDTRHDG